MLWNKICTVLAGSRREAEEHRLRVFKVLGLGLFSVDAVSRRGPEKQNVKFPEVCFQGVSEIVFEVI